VPSDTGLYSECIKAKETLVIPALSYLSLSRPFLYENACWWKTVLFPIEHFDLLG
jgi:hypothetical protein